jgi:uncharacterized protein (TIGR01777 family)
VRVVVTGGTGLIGRALVARLAADGHEAVVLSRHPDGAGGLPAGVRVVGWDARTARGWGELVDGAGAVVNLAGASIAGTGLPPRRWTAARKQLIRQSRIDAGRAVVEAVTAAADRPGVLIQASGVGYYGVHGDEEITEEHPPGTDFLAGTCQPWEDSTRPVEELGVRRCVIRSGVVLSRSGGSLPVIALPFRLFAGGRIGSGRQQFPWIHLDDAVAAITFLIGTPTAAGPVNLTAPNPVTNAQFGRALAAALHRPYWLPTPAAAMRLAFGELSTIVLDGQRAVPHRLTELGFQFRYPDVGPALTAIYDPAEPPRR